jgi:hypothetical protein
MRHRMKSWAWPFSTLLTLVLLMANAAADADHPNMFSNQSEIDGIRAMVQAGREPWISAYTRMISEVGAIADNGYYSVVKNNGSHLYQTDPPYLSDGIYDPDADRLDFEEMIQLSRAVQNLGIAYALSDDAAYADRAIDLLNQWAVAPETYMDAQQWSDQSQIEITITLPAAFYGADLLYHYPGWEPGERQAFFDWVADIGQHARGLPPRDNNWENHRLNLIAAAGALLDDGALLTYASYMIHPGNWPYEQIRAFQEQDGVAVYEMAYSYYQDSDYLAVIDHWGRPTVGIEVLRQPTLTHGNLFELDTGAAPHPSSGDEASTGGGGCFIKSLGI